MKKIFIYYSLSGNGDFISKYLSKKNIDIRKIEIRDKFPKSYVFQIIVGGFLASIKNKAKLKEYDKNIKEYNEVIIGSPIWNDRLTPAINSVLEDLDLTNKKVSFILYSGSGKTTHAYNYLKEKYNNCKIIVLKEPLKNKNELKKINI